MSKNNQNVKGAAFKASSPILRRSTVYYIGLFATDDRSRPLVRYPLTTGLCRSIALETGQSPVDVAVSLATGNRILCNTWVDSTCGVSRRSVSFASLPNT